MRITLLVLAVAASALGGCRSTDLQRAAVGAAGGALISDATGGSALVGAAIGGAGGALCDDVNLCR
jgi:osmotically inducible lipoprotein OsmB